MDNNIRYYFLLLYDLKIQLNIYHVINKRDFMKVSVNKRIAVFENIFFLFEKCIYHPHSKLTHLKIIWQFEVFRSAQSFTCTKKNPSIQYLFWKFILLQFNKLFTGSCCIELVSLLCSKLGQFNETPMKCDTNDKLMMWWH